MGPRRHGRRSVPRMLLVASVLIGLMGMHTLVDPVGTATASAPGAAAAHHEHPRPTVDDRATEHCEDRTAHALHLCPAVTGGDGPVLAVVWPFLGLVGFPPALRPTRPRAGSAPATRPPPLARRLARLCVWRN